MGIEIKTKNTYFYICEYSKEYQLSKLPWKNRGFDALIVIFKKTAVYDDKVRILIEELVRRNTDWIDTIGPKSEWLHDEIDATSVKLGRQKKAGDGSPMTGWQEDMKQCSEIAEYVEIGGSGGYDNKLVVVIGTHRDFTKFVDELKRYISLDEGKMGTATVYY